jgi:hypothetical protein
MGSLFSLIAAPNSDWLAVVRPRDWLDVAGPMALAHLLPANGLERAQKVWGLDAHQVPEAVWVHYSVTDKNVGERRYESHAVFARLQGAPEPILSAFERRVLPPRGETTAGDGIRVAWGSYLDGSPGKLAILPAASANVIVSESFSKSDDGSMPPDSARSRPVKVATALAESKLDAKFSLAADKSLAPAIEWVSGVALGALARCPLADALANPAKTDDSNVAFNECFSVAGRLEIGLDQTHIVLRSFGAWGKDATLVREQLEAFVTIFERSDIGGTLRLKDAPMHSLATDSFVEVALDVSSKDLAAGLSDLMANRGFEP